MWESRVGRSMVKPVRHHTRFEKARIIGARALQISMGAPLYVTEDELREKFNIYMTPYLADTCIWMHYDTDEH